MYGLSFGVFTLLSGMKTVIMLVIMCYEKKKKKYLEDVMVPLHWIFLFGCFCEDCKTE